MAASSPVVSSNGGGGGENTPVSVASTPPPPTPPAAAAASPLAAGKASPGLPTITLQRSEPTKSLRGLNKPKCIQCGNVARSRCPFQSCKSCCSKAQNPCHIHVLKPNATLADRGSPASSPASGPQQQSNEVPPSGPPAKVSSLRQLSSTFAQFNNVHVPLRSKKSVTKKEALAINEWRFAKLKEYRERNIEAENEAFDRYMQNISLLEEVFDLNTERPNDDGTLEANPPTTSGGKKDTISETKVKLRSNPVSVDKFRKRIQQTVDQGLRKLRKFDPNDDSANDLHDGGACDMATSAAKNWWAGKSSALTDLNERLNRARNEEDLRLCVQTISKIRGLQKASSQKKTDNTEMQKDLAAPDQPSAQDWDVSPLKPIKNAKIGQDALNKMDMHFSSIEEIEDL